MPARTDRQYRLMVPLAAVAEGTQRLLESDYYVEGRFTTFDQPYDLGGGYKEVIERGALDEADITDVIMQYDHEGRVLARNRNNTLVIRAAEARVGADLSKGESARQLHEEITNGLVNRMSWAFTIADGGDRFDKDSKTFHVSRVKKIFDVSAVSIPANDATEISARARVDGVIETEHRESEARKAKVLQLLTRL